MQFDVVIENGAVVDGTGTPRFPADIGIRAGRIAAVAREVRLDGARVIDATSMVVAPGSWTWTRTRNGRSCAKTLGRHSGDG